LPRTGIDCVVVEENVDQNEDELAKWSELAIWTFDANFGEEEIPRSDRWN